MNSGKRLVLSLLAWFSWPMAEAQTQFETQDSGVSLGLAPYLSTIFPIFYGVGGKIAVNRHFELGLSYGYAPQPYYSVIGWTAAEFGGNDAYQDVIEAAFQNNSIWLTEFHYNFDSPRSGLFLRAAYFYLESTGSSDVDTVLEAATGESHTLLKLALTAAGRSQDVHLDGTLHIGEIGVGYNWAITDSIVLSASAGLAKVFSTEVKLKTGLPLFEGTAAGSNLLRTSERGLEDIILDYGLSPTIGLTVAGYFP